MSEFVYVDMRSASSPEWKRIRVDEMERYLHESGGVDYYVSLQLFKSPIQPQKDDTEHDLYTSDFILDVDVKGDLDKALAETRDIVRYFQREIGIQPPYPRVWFSGQKGFHIVIHRDILGIQPHVKLYSLFKRAAEEISKALKVTGIDYNIYSNRRLMRYPNSIHSKTRLHKIELSHEELRTLTVDQIKELAKTPREPLKFRFLPVDLSDTGAKWWSALVEHWNNSIQYREMQPRAKIKVIKKEYPRCINYLMNTRPQEGTRNRVTYVLASFLLNQGVSEKEATKKLTEWVEMHYGDEFKKLGERVANTISVIKTVYEAKYFFSCTICQSLDSTTSYCDGLDKCKFIEHPDDQQINKVPLVTLNRASRDIYFNKTLRIPVYVVGKYDTPYKIPTKVKAECLDCPDVPDGECGQCPLYGGKAADLVISIKTRRVLSLIDVPDDVVYRTLRSMLGLGKCPNAKVTILTEGNMQVLILNPMADNNQNDKTGYMESGKSEFVTRTGFFLGHDIESNANYYINCTTVGHPKSQEIVHLIDGAEPAYSDVDSFNPSPEILKSLEVFRPAPGQSIEDKFNEIHEDFECNVHRVIKRRILAFAVDLAYHTAISFHFHNEKWIKGWMEVVIVGDSAQGKTEVGKKMHEHFQLGGWTGAEGEGRTGLAFSKQKMGTGGGKGAERWQVKWGLIPQNDRGLLNIDEFEGINLEAFAELTKARDEGIVAATGVKAGFQTFGRTRAIYYSNARDKYKKPGSAGVDGGSIGQYAYGVEAVAGLYGSHQDVRRVDFAVVVKKGDVSAREINTIMTKSVPHIYTTELCKNLILWVWSRTMTQIIIEPDVVQEILDAATRIANKYATSKMMLVDASTQKKKLGRMAVAVAARMFSTNDDMSCIVVKKEHVEFAEHVFYMSYDSTGMQYDIYAAHNRDLGDITEDEKDEIMNVMKNATGGHLNMSMVLKTIMDTEAVHAGILQSCGMNQDQARSIVIMLRERNLLDGNDHKTSTGVELFKNLYHRFSRGK